MEETKNVVLCAASAYEEKYYLNPGFKALPENIKKELQILCVLYTHKVGGILLHILHSHSKRVEPGV